MYGEKIINVFLNKIREHNKSIMKMRLTIRLEPKYQEFDGGKFFT